MHMRLQPFGHRFRYRVFSLLLDIDRLAETASVSRWFSVNRFNLASFHERDHGPRDGTALRPWVDAQLAAAGRPPASRVLLLSMPRLFGYAFNPLSVFWCHGEDGRLDSVIYEVKNTFGDQYPYVLPADVDADGAIRHDQAKEFFVSPFIGMDQTYRFTLRPPGRRLAIRIKQADANGDYLIATQSGDARAMTGATLAAQIARMPFTSLKVIAAIHWQALRLWLKGAKFLGYPGEDNVIRRQADHAHPRTTA
jgi:DUF1365 family protein